MYAYIFLYAYSGKDFNKKMSPQLKLNKELSSSVYALLWDSDPFIQANSQNFQ